VAPAERIETAHAREYDPPRAENPLVSAVIPVYNNELFVAEAIESVLAQTYSPVECLVIDDGSTDRSSEIAASYGSSVTVIRKENGGVGRARNLGAERARGKYVAFLDADDVWLPEKLERQMALFEADPGLGFAYCALTITDERLNVIREQGAPPPARAIEMAVLLESPPMALAQSGVIPLEVFRAVGGFRGSMPGAEDTDLACRIAASHPIAAVDAPLVLYRQHPGQMHRNLEPMERAILTVFKGIFSDPAYAYLWNLRRSSFASLYFTLGLARLRQGMFLGGLRYLARSFRYSPRRWVVLLGRGIRRKSGFRSGAHT
jgi:glycosyltransferase involved in cell wall biosynthesis